MSEIKRFMANLSRGYLDKCTKKQQMELERIHCQSNKHKIHFETFSFSVMRDGVLSGSSINRFDINNLHFVLHFNKDHPGTISYCLNMW